MVGNIDQYKASNQTEIRFRPGQTVLSKNAKDALDTMAGGVKGQRGYIIEVQGFSSGKGQTAITNSQKMAESVVRYLVLNHEIPVYRIYLVGMGNAPAPSTDDTAKTKRISGGRVEISLLKNDLEQLSANTGAPCHQRRSSAAAEVSSCGTEPQAQVPPPEKASRASERLFLSRLHDSLAAGHSERSRSSGEVKDCPRATARMEDLAESASSPHCSLFR